MICLIFNDLCQFQIVRSILKTQARIRLFHFYIYLSIGVVSIFTVLFAIKQFWPAAILQGLFLVPFLSALHLYSKGYHIFSKWLTILASSSIVLLQTNYVFTSEAGFHYQLIALIVVAFLICDLKELSETWLAIAFSVIISACFFLSETVQIAGPIILLSAQQNMLFKYMSLTTTLVALSWLLFYYSKILANTERELSALANTDALTKIHNRGYFMREGERIFQALQSKHQPISAIIFDIDDFKRINDDFGHPVGDKVLIRLSHAISSLVGSKIIFSRYGGEEFALLLPGKDIKEAYDLAEHIRKTTENLLITTGSYTIKCTISIGVSSNHTGKIAFDELMISADRALYHAKHNGKNLTIADCGEQKCSSIRCIK